MDLTGNTVARVVLKEDNGVTDLSWNCERFNMEEQIEGSKCSGKRADGNKIDHTDNTM